MKHHYFLLFLLIPFMVACSKQSAPSMETYSSDREMKITLNGSRSNPLDSWLIEIELDHAGSQSKVFQEFYADEVSRNNITFEWKTNRACLIHMTQRDGIVITVPIKVASM